MFIFHLTYVKPLEEVEKFLPAHIAYLEENYEAGNFICSGRKSPRTGGIILGKFTDEESARKALTQDPFYMNGIAEYEVIAFTPTKYSAAFAGVVEG